MKIFGCLFYSSCSRDWFYFTLLKKKKWSHKATWQWKGQFLKDNDCVVIENRIPHLQFPSRKPVFRVGIYGGGANSRTKYRSVIVSRREIPVKISSIGISKEQWFGFLLLFFMEFRSSIRHTKQIILLFSTLFINRSRCKYKFCSIVIFTIPLKITNNEQYGAPN